MCMRTREYTSVPTFQEYVTTKYTSEVRTQVEQIRKIKQKIRDAMVKEALDYIGQYMNTSEPFREALFSGKSWVISLELRFDPYVHDIACQLKRKGWKCKVRCSRFVRDGDGWTYPEIHILANEDIVNKN